jgi:hypothetical protein
MRNIQLREDDMTRIALMFWHARQDPSVIIERCDKVVFPTTGTVWWRCIFHPDKVFQPDAADCMTAASRDQAYDHVGVHGTDTTGTCMILRELRLRRMTMPGVYCLAGTPKHFAEVKELAAKVIDRTKNLCDVIFELQCKAECVGHKKGSVEVTDADVVSTLRISHIRRTDENRYCFPESISKLRAFWFCFKSVQDIATTELIPM